MAKLMRMVKDYTETMPGGTTFKVRKGTQQKFNDGKLTDKLLSEGYAVEVESAKKTKEPRKPTEPTKPAATKEPEKGNDNKEEK